ncbi:MAG: hypothetical protein HRU07_05665 [Nitrosopumilus sp.]|nr:hypothetical protein [Nitrosopumilus sp.]NRA05633.1 hypothetical protein [Nitrosopumilus sp.]
MNLRWISKDSGTCHIYIGVESLCKSENIVKPFAKKYSCRNTQDCDVCKGIVRSDQHKKIKIIIARYNVKTEHFHKKWGIFPVDALLNLLTLQDTILEDIQELSANDFGGIEPVDVLADAITSKKVCCDDGGIICSVSGGKIL